MKDIRIITANTAAAIAASLCRVQVIAAYPITPQTPVTEELAAMVERGELNAEYLTVESEHSAMASVVAASQMGARVFTASSANGLLYMHEMLHWAAGSRVPVVMACVNRGVGAPWTILNDQQDSISQRDTGWIQLYCRNSQEVLDTLIQAYKIAERVLIPVMVCYDGFVLSHASTPVEAPVVEDVDKFLPPCPIFTGISEGSYMNLNPLILSEPRQDAEGNLRPGYMDLRYKLQEDLISSLEIIKETDREFEAVFGRSWGGPVWSYRMEDADHALVSMGSLASECTLAADSLRQQGFRTGVVGVRAYRPFPAEALCKALQGVQTVAVFEKDVSYGYMGAVATDLKAALFERDLRPKVASFVAGLGGRDVRPEQLAETAAEAITKRSAHKWIDVRG
ncbi:MAG: pyruvate ferredoxin oxidoreductase [Desulfomonile tiedjei]|uniref:Pyruvate ferredoxin oxidoreductase n=1 Tax=Desulfomonile tiedjei TaxID=2358 RepID=A0A9D6V192_9BACT|nr:pyruvate ferredoxin oxidoreductase [Desulfomonile tiedjei]